MTTKKASVILRGRVLPSGKKSLYLDIYAGGKRKTESLNLFIIPEATRKDKEYNKEVIREANIKLYKRQEEVAAYGFNGRQEEKLFFTDFAIQEIKTKKGNTKKNYLVAFNALYSIYPKLDGLKVSDITNDILQEWRNRLLACQVSNSTKANYFTRWLTIINEAVKRDIIKKDPTKNIKKIKPDTAERQYLTKEELQKLINTPFPKGGYIFCRAFLFSCFTGLRYSDVSTITWGEVHKQDNYTRIFHKQVKTSQQEYIDLAPQAVEQMGERQSDTSLIFDGIQDIYKLLKIIKEWVTAAGINKHITFHCARHTFAVLMLDLDVDIYTVSKLLGHTDVATTQIYAKILDRKKQDAINRIDNFFKKEEANK